MARLARLEAEFQRLGPDTVAALCRARGRATASAPPPEGSFRAVRAIIWTGTAPCSSSTRVMCGMGRTARFTPGNRRAYARHQASPGVRRRLPADRRCSQAPISSTRSGRARAFQHGHTYLASLPRGGAEAADYCPKELLERVRISANTSSTTVDRALRQICVGVSADAGWGLSWSSIAPQRRSILAQAFNQRIRLPR